MRLPSPGLMRVFAMELFTKLFGDLLLFVYHCFDRIVINGYLSGLSRPEQVVHFFRKVVGVAVLSKEILSQRTAEYQNWVEAFARNHNIPVEWAEKGVRKEDYVLPWLRRMTKRNAYGVYFIFKSMEQGPTFRVTVPKYPTCPPAQPLHPRLLLHPRRSSRPHGDACRNLLPVPNDILPQRPQLHRAGAQSCPGRLPQERQCLPGG